MKNTMKKFIGIIMILAIMMGIGITANAVYETEEVPSALIMELVDAGFKPSEDDEDIWIFDGYYPDDEMYYFGYFNVAENYGAIYGDNHGGERCIIAIRWDNIYEEFEELGEGLYIE